MKNKTCYTVTSCRFLTQSTRNIETFSTLNINYTSAIQPLCKVFMVNYSTVFATCFGAITCTSALSCTLIYFTVSHKMILLHLHDSSDCISKQTYWRSRFLSPTPKVIHILLECSVQRGLLMEKVVGIFQRFFYSCG